MPEICASSLLQDDFISAIPSAPLLMKVCKKLALSRPLQNPFGPGNLLLCARVGEIRGYFGELTDVDVHYHYEDSCVR